MFQCAGLKKTGLMWRLLLLGGVTFAPLGSFQLSSPPDPAIESIFGPNLPSLNQTINLSIRNKGLQATSVDVVFYRGDPRVSAASELGRLKVSLAAGGSAYPISPGAYNFADGEIFTVCIDPDATAIDSNRNNNCLAHTTSTLSTDLQISVADISITPPGADVEEPITVGVRVRNGGTSAATTVLRLWQGHPLAPGSVRLRQVPVSVPASGTGLAVWNLRRPAGDTNFWVAAEDVVPRESAEGDNLASRNLFLKASINTGRKWGNSIYSTMPAVGDLFQSGQPVMDFGELSGVNNGLTTEGHLTALQLLSDGTTRELWSKVPQPAPSEVIAPQIADLDGDGSPEIITQVVHDPNPTPGGPGVPGEIYVYVYDRNGNVRWSHMWRTFPNISCNHMYLRGTPILGDMNGDGFPDITVIEREIVVLDGRTGNELIHRAWPTLTSCPGDAHGVVADLDGDGRNELVVAETGIHAVNNDGTIRWTANNGEDFALVDVDGDGKPEVVIPVHRAFMEILDAKTGTVKKQVGSFPPFYQTIAATTSLLASGLPAIIASQNDYAPATAALDGALNKLWFRASPIGSLDNPMNIVLADVLGQGRPQVISRTDRRYIRIQDVRDGSFLFDSSIYGKSAVNSMWPAVVDVDGDGRGEIIVPYGSDWTYSNTKAEFEPVYAPMHFLVFGGAHWSKLSTTWNQQFFNQGEVDQRLAWRGDYTPWKTHNTWRQQPVRPPCDLDGDFDVDSDDIAIMNSLRGTQVQPGDRRDIDQDGTITVADARACTLKCTLKNCAAIQPPARILSLEPRTVYPGVPKTVLIRGEFLGLQNGVTTASLGEGVSVGGGVPGAAGPVTVIDANTAQAVVSVSPGSTGDRTLTLITAAKQASRLNALMVSQGNRPPSISAGNDTTVLLPDSVQLNGSASDDGLPAGRGLTYSWQYIAGPGTVTFSNASRLSTSATFTGPGFYQLRLTVNDGELFSIADIGVRVIQPNRAPVVNAGPDFAVASAGVPITINGSVSDDGKPFGGLTSQWEKVAGPGAVTFASAMSPVTTASFSAVGTYVLRLSASDTEFSSFDEVTAVVGSADARLLSVSPGVAQPGQTIQRLHVVGQGVLFETGNVMLSLGEGVAVGGAAPGAFGPVDIVNPTTLAAKVAIQSGALPGPRSAVVKIGPQLVTRNSAFSIAVGSSNKPVSIRVNVSNDFVEPGGSITVSADALDAAGAVVATPAANFTIFISPAGATIGSAPVVQLPLIHFPKLQKQKTNNHSDIDPGGRYAFTPRSDPNYGKETGGIYNVTAQLNGTTLTATTQVLVMPNGTHELTARGIAYNTRLLEVLGQLQAGFVAGDGALVNAGKSALDQLRSNDEWTAERLKLNRADVPPDGGLPTVDAVRNRGLGGGSGDALFASRLDVLRAAIASAKVQLVKLDVPLADAAPDLTSLQNAVTALEKAFNDFQVISPSTLAIRQQTDKLNLLETVEIPELLDALKSKTAELMEQAPALPSATALQKERAALSGEAKLEVVTKVLSLVTNLSGAARKSAIQAGIHLINMVVNLVIADMINAVAPPGMYIEAVHASASFGIACPIFPDTYVGATGLNPDPKRNSVVLIGCINDSALTTLLTLKNPADFFDKASGLNIVGLFLWENSVAQLIKSLDGWTKWAAQLNPDLIREGPYGVWPLEAVSPLGWPKVNQSRLPCAGVVIVTNLDTGAFEAWNHTFLKECAGQ